MLFVEFIRRNSAVWFHVSVLLPLLTFEPQRQLKVEVSRLNTSPCIHEKIEFRSTRLNIVWNEQLLKIIFLVLDKPVCAIFELRISLLLLGIMLNETAAQHLWLVFQRVRTANEI